MSPVQAYPGWAYIRFDDVEDNYVDLGDDATFDAAKSPDLGNPGPALRFYHPTGNGSLVERARGDGNLSWAERFKIPHDATMLTCRVYGWDEAVFQGTNVSQIVWKLNLVDDAGVSVLASDLHDFTKTPVVVDGAWTHHAAQPPRNVLPYPTRSSNDPVNLEVSCNPTAGAGPFEAAIDNITLLCVYTGGTAAAIEAGEIETVGLGNLGDIPG